MEPFDASPEIRFLALSLLLFLVFGCSGETQSPVKEKGRWVETPFQALYIVYEARTDVIEEQLKQALQPKVRDSACS